MLDEDTVFEHADLDAAAAGTNDHDPVDAFPTSEELGLGDDRSTTPGIATVATALLLGLEPGGTLDSLRLGDGLRRLARLAHLDDDIRFVVARARLLAGTTTRPATHTLGGIALVVVVCALVAAVLVAVALVAVALARKRWQWCDVRRLEQERRGGTKRRSDRRARRLGSDRTR